MDKESGFVGGYARIMIREATPAQKRAARLSGAKRQFPLGLFVCHVPSRIFGNVEGYRLTDSGVEIQIDSHWYAKSEITKDTYVMRLVRREARKRIQCMNHNARELKT